MIEIPKIVLLKEDYTHPMLELTEGNESVIVYKIAPVTIPDCLFDKELMDSFKTHESAFEELGKRRRTVKVETVKKTPEKPKPEVKVKKKKKRKG